MRSTLVSTVMTTSQLRGDHMSEVPDERAVWLQSAFDEHRRELHVHCYRLAGNVMDADDLVQETFLRAWRARERFEGRASARTWLYRIATNACLNAIAVRAQARRILPDAYAPPAQDPRQPLPPPDPDIAWLEPYPDTALNAVADA